MNETKDFELKILMFIGRHLPPLPHITGISNRMMKPFYLRKNRDPVTVDVLDFKMILDPKECVDGNLLFHPHLYDRDEIGFLREKLHEGDNFLDVGANIGFYSLAVSDLVGKKGKVISIEADPTNYDKLMINIKLNGKLNIKAVNMGVSDKIETLMLGICTIGNRGGNFFLRAGDEKVEVACCPLLDIVSAEKLQNIKAMKIDIEGYEYRVLSKFFLEAPATLHPELIIIEHIPDLDKAAGGNCIKLLIDYGYIVLKKYGDNHVMVKK